MDNQGAGFQTALRQITKGVIENVCEEMKAFEPFLFDDEELVGQAKESLENELGTFFQGINTHNDLHEKLEGEDMPGRDYLKLRFVQKLHALALEKMQREPANSDRFEDNDQALQWVRDHFRLVVLPAGDSTSDEQQAVTSGPGSQGAFDPAGA